MVRHSVFRWSVAVLALTWAGTSRANSIVSPLFQTGDVEKDFSAASKTVTVIPGQPLNSVAQPQWMTSEGRINGYVMKDIRLSYDKTSDTLSVGVNFWGTAGNTDGSPNGVADPRTIAAGGANPLHIGGDKSVSVAFTPVTAAGTAASPLVIAGVPADKTSSPIGSLDGFKVAAYQASNSGLGRSYGATLSNNQGALAYDPTAEHPDFEFTVKNFSKIPGLNALTKGFYVSAYAGTGATTIIGKSMIFDSLVSAPIAGPQNLNGSPGPVNVPTPTGIVTPTVHPTPEPTTILAWGLVAGCAAFRVRRRLARSIRP